MYMLDTNIIIFCIRHPYSECAQKLVEHLGKDVCISVITYSELEYGILNSSKPEQNRQAINAVLVGIPIVEFDIAAAKHFGAILAEMKKEHKERQNQDRDKMIAAHARSKGFILVTNNLKDFSDINDLRLEDWRSDGDLAR